MKVDQTIVSRIDKLITMGERVTKTRRSRSVPGVTYHGKWNEFSNSDAEDMIRYVRSFMGEHLA